MGLERMSCEKIGRWEVCGRPTLCHVIIEGISFCSGLYYKEWK